jgi:hypothetical protein
MNDAVNEEVFENDEEETKPNEIDHFEFDCKNFCNLFSILIEHLTKESEKNNFTEKPALEDIKIKELNTFITNVNTILTQKGLFTNLL